MLSSPNLTWAKMFGWPGDVPTRSHPGCVGLAASSKSYPGFRSSRISSAFSSATFPLRLETKPVSAARPRTLISLKRSWTDLPCSAKLENALVKASFRSSTVSSGTFRQWNSASSVSSVACETSIAKWSRSIARMRVTASSCPKVGAHSAAGSFSSSGRRASDSMPIDYRTSAKSNATTARASAAYGSHRDTLLAQRVLSSATRASSVSIRALPAS